jgi:hypothetical protein
MSYKFSVAPVVRVPVKFSAADGAKSVPFSFTLICKRLEQSEVSERVSTDAQTVREFMSDVVTGWEGQTLVLEEATGQPAAFSPEALAAMFEFPGVAFTAYQSYLKHFGAKEKN